MTSKPVWKPRLESHGTLYDLIGGRETCRRLSEHFHDRVAGDPALRDIFAKDLTSLTERFALFIAERLGGPAEYTTKRGKQSLICRHAHLSISSVESDAWLEHMFGAMEDTGITDPARQHLRDYFTATAQTLTDPLLPLYGLPLDELAATLVQNPALTGADPMGHTLLGEAVCRWDLPRVRMLIEHGADVNAVTRLNHGPLYQATNACPPMATAAQGRAVVELLLRHGADPNWPSGPGHSTPLHMTARRGHVSLAEALLDAGADIEKTDSKGETPLRRAVNCGQEAMVVFLLSRGANPLSRDKQGHSLMGFARQEGIRQALTEAVRRR